MLLHYLGKLKNQKFALLMHVKHISNATFCHLSNRCLPNVLKINVKINTTQNTPFSVLNELKECLIAVWSDFQQVIIDTAVDQWRKRLQACVRANGGHFEHFCEQTLANSLHFSRGTSWFKWLLSTVSAFLLCWCLMVNRPTVLHCKALSLLRTVNEQK